MRLLLPAERKLLSQCSFRDQSSPLGLASHPHVPRDLAPGPKVGLGSGFALRDPVPSVAAGAESLNVRGTRSLPGFCTQARPRTIGGVLGFFCCFLTLFLSIPCVKHEA